MEHLPQDPNILVSAVNMLLRDGEFDNLQAVCNYFEQNLVDLTNKLANAGYVYSEQQNQIRPIGFDQ